MVQTSFIGNHGPHYIGQKCILALAHDDIDRDLQTELELLIMMNALTIDMMLEID